MVKMSKRIGLLFLSVLCLLAIPSMTTYAAGLVKSSSELELGTQKVYKSYTINEDGTFTERKNVGIPKTSKYQQKNVVSKATGEVVGMVALYYDTRIEGGRPVFVGDVTIGAEFYGMYRGSWEITNPNIRDYIILKVSYSNMLDSGYNTIKFYPN